MYKVLQVLLNISYLLACKKKVSERPGLQVTQLESLVAAVTGEKCV